ncbi:MAG: hypothetical protein ACOH1I_08350 [Gallionellaceae bacterium]|jgi:hypothetical protein
MTINIILLSTATVLGLLAFFEPCTIATHTLFAVRTHKATPPQRWLALLQLVLPRMALLATLFGSAAWVGLSAISQHLALFMLGMIGAIYLFTRKIYLPVPHLEFFRLLPGHEGLSQGLKLGLTLPACTLPLVAVVGVLAALSQQPATALLAGVIFASMFSLPTLWNSVRGLDAAHRSFLGKVASISPYITALLLWGAAWMIFITGV